MSRGSSSRCHASETKDLIHEGIATPFRYSIFKEPLQETKDLIHEGIATWSVAIVV